MNHETQVGKHQAASRIQVVVVIKAVGQIALLLDAEDGYGVDSLHVGRKVLSGRQHRHRLQTFVHTGLTF